ncbi:MAG: penicillin-binding transpeptidase domain-containing protein, partial [candidate division WOR-3 bacterium]
GAFLPHNYDEQFHGPVRLRNALACSYNIPAVRVCEQVGTDRLLTRLRQLGFTSLDRPASHYGLALTLGSGDITLLELTRAYACLANGGDYQPEQTIIATENSRADRSPGPAARPVLPPWAAYVITDILADNSARIPAFGQYSALNLGFPCAAKTGTSKDYRDNWTVGYTTEYVVGVWIGNFDGSPMRGVSGITGAAPLFRNIMLFLHPTEPAPFVEPSGLCHQHICPKSGMCCGPDCPNSVTELFRVGTEPTQVCDVHQRYRLDRRTGLAAAQDTRPEDVEEVIFEVYPSLYYGWMQSVGLPFPPVCASSPDDLSPRSGRLAIVFPDPGSIFRIDPDLDPSFQAIQLEAEAPADCEMVSWAIDGELVATTPRPFQHFWPLSPGRHRIACAGPDGARAEVSILVLGPPERSPRDSAQVRSPDSDSLPAGFQGPGPWCPTGL